MKGLLLRVGIDMTCGRWNGPVDPASLSFVYIPIPETPEFEGPLSTPYSQFNSPLKRFSASSGIPEDIFLPESLSQKMCHLDPDFEHLTYGDQPVGRGAQVSRLERGDFVVFFASLKPVRECGQNLVYALIGIYFVDRITTVATTQDDQRYMNAHTRRNGANPVDVILWAAPKRSGRFETCIPIGERRGNAYRVQRSLLEEWGDLDVKNGYIQRSAKPPYFLNPAKFLKWLDRKAPTLLHVNNEL